MRRIQKRKRAHRLGSIEREVLEELRAGDLLYGFLLSARSRHRMYKLAHERASYRQRRKRAIQRLIDQEFILERSGRLFISARGKGVIGLAITRAHELLKEGVWDGKWRVVVFDIPNKYTHLRNQIRTLLKRAGFVQLQQSVWVFPYECKELTDLIKAESDLSPHILYGVLESIEGEHKLRKVFGL